MDGSASRVHGVWRALVAIVILSLSASACGTPTPTPVPSASRAASPASSEPALGPSALDECDPTGFVPCEQQAAFISIPIPDTGVALTWSSQWAAGRTDRSGWDASSLGLGGWSLDVVQRYQATGHALIGGDGSWRFVAGTQLASGGLAVPAYDGSLAYVFDASGRHVNTVDGLLGVTLLTLTYDDSGALERVDGTSAGHPVHAAVVRSTDGTAQALTGIDGARTSLQLDGTGRLSAITDPAGRTTQLAYGNRGLVTTETDPLGAIRRFTYDQDGRLVGSSDADGVTEQRNRTSTSTSVEIDVTTALGHVTRYRTETTAGGTMRTMSLPGGATTTETTAADGSIALALADGTKRTIGATPSITWGSGAPVPTPDVTQRPDGVTSRTEIAQALTEVGGLPYALSGTITTTVNGAVSVETLDPASRTLTVIDAAGRKTVQSFDTAGRIVAESTPGSAAQTFTYDAQGRESSVTTGAGTTARTTTYGYDTTTGRSTITRPDGSVLDVGVDADGRVTSVATPDGSTAINGYDADGRVSQLQPAGGLTFTLGYSAAGRPSLFLPPSASSDSSAETTTYNADGLPTAIAGLGGRSVGVTYDSSGRLASWTVAGGVATQTYDPTTGLEASSVDPGGASTAHAYAGGVLDGLSWAGTVAGSVAVKFDANGRPAASTVDGAAGDTWTYDGAGALTAIDGLALSRDSTTGLLTAADLGAVKTVLQYDDLDQLVRSTTTASGTVVLDQRYARDALGRIANLTEATPAGTSTTTYTYDRSDRLASITVNGKLVERDTYNAAGDRTQIAAPAGTTGATYDARDRLETWGGRSYTWAADGTLASIATVARTPASTTFHYDELGDLRSVQLPDGRTVAYLVDAEGRRVGREVGGTLVAGYLYDPAGKVVAQTDPAGAVVARFAYDDQGHLALVEKGGDAYRVIVDQVGSPRLVIDAISGTIAESLDYDAWGRITRDSAPGFIPFGFGGGLVDPDTGLVHLGARDYDPSTGRWISSDPIRFAGGDPDLYRYAGDDAVNQTDPTGLASTSGSGCFESIFCGQGSIGFNNWDISYNLKGCIGPACGTFCDAGSCSQHPHDIFTCSGIFCMGGACIYTWCSWGDTHLYTADGVHLNFQAAGEFVVTRSPDGRLEIQARQEPVLGGTLITFNTAVAALVDGDRVGVYAGEPSFLVVNGQPVPASDISERLPHGGAVERHGSLVTVDWADGSRLTITRNADTLDYTFAPSTAIGPSLKGLLGSADGNAANDLTGRDGQVLSRTDPDFGLKLYSQFGDSWRITQAESLFDYQPGESTAAFTHLAIPSAPVTVDSLPAAARSTAQAICMAAGVRAEPILDDCLIDVGMTGEASFAAGSAAVAAAGAAVSTRSTPEPPGQVTPITVGQTISGSIAAAADLADYTFSATAGQVVYLQSHTACTGTLGWDLLTPSGGDFGGSLICNDLQREVLSSEGTYTVRINGDRSATGAYSFTVLAVPQTVVTPVQVGGTISGSLSSPGQWADYTFSATAGEAVYVEHGTACTGLIEWELHSPTGAPLASTTSCNDLDRVDLPQSGTYTIRFAGDHTTIGAYSASLLAVPPTVVTPITLGQAVSGALTSPGQRADYSFSATAGEVIQPQAHGTCVPGLGWQLLGPDGGLLDFTVACHDLGRDTLNQSGTYTIREYGDRTSIGAYSFTLSPAS